VGNAAVQAALAVSDPDDPSERVANRVADQVLATTSGAIDEPPTPVSGATAVRTDSGAARTGDGSGPPDVLGSLRGGGRPLPWSVRSEFEQRLDHDFGDVRIHTGSRGDAIARSLDARAVTAGTDVVFRSGEYRPSTPSGKHLLAHELTHVVQQRGRLGGLQRASDAVGEPQRRPDVTYVVEEDEQDDALEMVANYHSDVWGLETSRIGSIEDLVNALAGLRSPVNRIRIVAHANEDRLIVPMFNDSESSHDLEELAAFADGPLEGMSEMLENALAIGGADWWDPNEYIDHDVLAPFGLGEGEEPEGELRLLIDEVLRYNLIKQVEGEDSDIAEASGDHVNRLASTVKEKYGIEDNSNIRDLVAAIENVAESMNQNRLGEVEKPVAAAGALGERNFAEKYRQARDNVEDSGWIDLRGCRIGQSPEYMRTLGRFFGSDDSRPSVSAPKWKQTIMNVNYHHAPEDEVVDELFDGSGPVASALEHWSPQVGVEELLRWQRAQYRKLKQASDPADEWNENRPSLAGDLEVPAGTLPKTPPEDGSHDDLIDASDEAFGDDLSTPQAELRMYLRSDMILPVRNLEGDQTVTLVARDAGSSRAIENWKRNQWDDQSGLSELDLDWGDVTMLLGVRESDDSPNSDVFFPPDPRYRDKIVEE